MLRRAFSITLLVQLAAFSPSIRGQDQPKSTTPQKESKPASDQAAPKNPGEVNKDAPGSDAAPAGGDAAPQQPPKKSSADENPFPEEQSKSAAKQVEEGQAPPTPLDLQGDGTAGKSNQPDAGKALPNDGGVSSSRTRLEGLDQGDQEVARKVLPKVSDVRQNPKMAAEDVAIGKMYYQSENYRGAYLRYKEALSLDPESPDAAFGVAEASRKLNQTKEAIESYQLCLNLDPSGPRSKAARKALATLSTTTAH